MHLLVVGGNGFIGSDFVPSAVDAGHRVTVLGRDNPQPVFDHGRPFDFLGGGLNAVENVKNLLVEIDVVCCFASTSTPASAEIAPLQDMEENYVAVNKLLKVMRIAGPRRLIFLSSGGAVYGRPRVTPIPETHPCNPIGAYGSTKLAIEKLIETEAAEHNLEALILRPSNPYGPGQQAKPGSGVIPSFITAVKSNQPITLYGNGGIVRDFLHVSDLTNFIMRALETGLLGTFNVGSGVGTNLSTLLDTIEQEVGRTVARNTLPPRPFDPPELVLDISKAQMAVDWNPKISLVEGIRKTVLATF